MGWLGRRLRGAWLLLAVGLCLLAVVAVDATYYALGDHGTPGAHAVNAHYPLPAVTGVLHVRDPIYHVERVGDPCKGLGAYDGLLGGTSVLVKDQTGAVIATGVVDIGKVVDRSTCEFALAVQGVPKADVYQFEVLGRAAGTYSYNDVVVRGWDVALSLT